MAVFSRDRKMAKRDFVMSVRLSVRMEQLGSHLIDLMKFDV
jgi:hypothetical protein